MAACPLWGKLGEGPPEIVGGDPEAQFPSVSNNDSEYRLRGDSLPRSGLLC